MSYILEALQKSEHARQRGKVPDLNTVPEATPKVAGHAAAHRPPYAAAGFALALAAAVLGWWQPWQAAEPRSSSPTPAPVTKATDDARPPAPAAPVAQAQREISAPKAPPQAAETVRPPRSEPDPRITAAVPTLPPPAPPAPVRAATAARNTPEPSSTASRRASGVARILGIDELPPAVRSSLPRLEISGFAAAPDAGKRMVVINDRLVQEGDEVEPGLRLTSAAKDSVVLDFKGYRFRAPQ